MQKHKLFLVIGPSGVGKGTAISRIKESTLDLFFPVSYTTREKRINEVDGQTYYFISKDEFENKIKQDDFLEYQVVHGTNYYGTDKRSIINQLQSKSVLREMDVAGVKDVLLNNKELPIVTIFITTDNWETLVKRINNRQQISEAELKSRKESFEKEMKFMEKSDYIVYSKENKIDELVTSIIDIIKTESNA